MKQEKRNILNSITKRWVAVFCIVCMLASVCFNEALVSAEGTTTETAATTEDPYHTDELKTEYAQWSLADVGMNSVTNATEDAYSDASKGADSLDKTIFNARITFPDFAGQFGRFYIGGKQDKTGFVFRNRSAKGTTDLRLQILYYHPTTGETHQYTIADFLEEDLGGLAIRGNEHLSVSLTVDYVDEYTIKGIEYVALKVGVFFNGARVGYYTTTNTGTKLVAPKSALSQRVYCQYQNAAYSIVSEDVWGEQKLYEQESEWDYWTLSDVGEADRTVDADGENTVDTAGNKIAGSLNKTMFTAKMKFPTDQGDFGRWQIGGSKDGAYGFVFRTNQSTASKDTAGKLQINYHSASQSSYSKSILVCDPTIAGVDLRGNEDLTVSLSVEYGDEVLTDSNSITYRETTVGVFFNGKLYNNEYITVNIPTADTLVKRVSFYSAYEYSMGSNHLWERVDDDVALEDQGFHYWTLSDLGEADRTFTKDGSTTDYIYPVAIGDSLNKTIFSAKINFPTTTTQTRWYIGGTSAEKDGNNGFLFRTDGTTTDLKFQYKDAQKSNTAGADTRSIITFNADTAGVTLRGNNDLRVSVSVEYLETVTINEIECAKVKLGVFFNGELYNNQYITTDADGYDIVLPKTAMKQKFYSYSSQTYGIASNYPLGKPDDDVFLKNQGFDYWTLSDVGEEDRTVDADEANTVDTQGNKIAGSLNKTIFTAKMKFPTDQGDFGRWQIGGSKNGAYGFVFRTNQTTASKDTAGKLQINYHSESQSSYSKGILVCDPTTAGVDLRGNDDLTVSLSVEYGDEILTDSNSITYRETTVGVFFNGKLYNNEYITVNIPTADTLVKRVSFYSAYEYSMGSNYLWERLYDETVLDTEGWDYWTLSDVGVEDQTFEGNGTDNNIVAYTNLSSSLDKTVFTATIDFPEEGDAKGTFGQYWIGGYNSVTGFHFRNATTNKTTLRLNYNYGTNTYIKDFDPTIAETTLRGNPDLKVSLSVEYLDTYVDGDVEYAKLKIGVFFDGKLYDDQYITTDGSGNDLIAPTASMKKGFYCFSQYDFSIGSAYNRIGELPVGWDVAKLRDFNITDGAYSNSAEEMTVNSYGVATNTDAFDHLAIGGEFLFKETANAYVNIGGADSNKGLKLYSDVETGSLKLAAASDSDTVVTMTSNVAGTTLVGEPVHIDITSQFVDMDGDDVYNDLKLGVYFNGLLYNATYYYYKDYITNGEFGNHLGFYTDDGGKICVVSEYTVDATQKTYDLTNGVYTTFKDEIEYAKFGEWIRTPLDSTNGLDIPGEYEISQYQGMKKESLDIYMTSDSNTDGTIDLRDLVSVKKAQAKTAASGTLPTIQALSVDTDKDGVISVSEVSAVVQKLLYADTSVAALCYETGVMPIGGYFGPSYYNAECNTLTNDVFKAIKDAGVDLIVSTNVKESSENSQINDVLQLAANNNLGVYINADNFTTKESVSDSDLTDLNNTYSKYTSFKGVYLVDEPYLESVYGDTDHESLSKYSSVATLLNSTTNLLGWANLFPKQDDLNLSSSLSLDESYRKYLNEYVKKYQPKFLSFDQYVWGSTETEVNHSSEQIQRNKMYFSALSDVRNVADSSNIPFWTVIQAGGNWNDAKVELDVTAPYAVPSEGQLLWNVNTSLAYGAKGLTYFPLVQPQHFAISTGSTMDYTRNGLIGADGRLTQWYPLAQKANKQVATVDEVLMESSSVRVLAEGYYAEKETEITNDFDGLDLKSITVETETTDYSYDAWPWGKREYGAVVGVFDYYGKEAYYVVNYDYMAARDVSLNFSGSKKYKVLAEDSNCTSTKGEGSGTSCSLNLTAGGAALVVVE